MSGKVWLPLISDACLEIQKPLKGLFLFKPVFHLFKHLFQFT